MFKKDEADLIQVRGSPFERPLDEVFNFSSRCDGSTEDFVEFGKRYEAFVFDPLSSILQ